jgi:hypothetical protein
MGAPKPLSPTVAELERDVCALRSQGVAYAEIAERLGLSGKGQAYRVCQRALRRIPADGVAEMRALEGHRLDVLTTTLWPRVIGGDLGAISTCLKVMERRARLFGLDAGAEPPVPLEAPADIDEFFLLAIERVAYFEDLVLEGSIDVPPHLREGLE